MPSRRDFFRQSLSTSSLISLGSLSVPTFLARSAHAAANEPGGKRGRVLVVVQMLGGNDGLNTVVPHKQDGYMKGRRALRLPDGRIHRVTDEIGLHPGMGQMAKLLESGNLSILQGVGYPNPDRSHFRSMEIWESARTETGATETGWLGRVLDANPAKPGDDLPALGIGGRRSLAFQARTTEVPTIDSLEQYRLKLTGDDKQRVELRQQLDGIASLDRSEDPLLGFVKRTAMAAFDSSHRLEKVASESASDDSSYPNYGLSRRLKLIAQLIKAGFGTSIYYTSLDGFDTHANQLEAHAGLLTELSDSLEAFHRDLATAGEADRVAVLSFSEFGRRVAENASAGTDHGAAAPAFVIGPVRQAGLVGDHPSLEDLDDGDLKFHTDFRCIYAAILKQWLGVPSESILGPDFPPLDLFKTVS